MSNVLVSQSSRDRWLYQLSDTISNHEELFHTLGIDVDKSFLAICKGEKRLFPLKVPRTFVARIEKGNLNDPLLKQVMITHDEFIVAPNYSTDPLQEQNNIVPCLLHKYSNRALLLVKSNCAINCRYCFRRHFPYKRNQGNKRNWKRALDYIAIHPELNEIIFSGGDPLMAKDQELQWLIEQLEKISHIKRLRIHSRLPIIIPARITNALISYFSKSRMQILLVNHINHANEISEDFYMAMKKLQQIGIILLNQSVLLRGVNDNPRTLAKLNDTLFCTGVMPYYLHILDKVQGAAHFMVDNKKACKIMKELSDMTSGYMVPKLMKNVGHKLNKTQIVY